ncbi:hypothetical protein [Ferrigenium sp. UT5]|uniref:hypothetical protein n=1 Tax=Ferrigenium sp. UT5 TaxID=3242105 RepID=UPI00354F28BF
MLIRLALFFCSLLLLPLLARWLADALPEWTTFPLMPLAPLALTLVAAILLLWLADTWQARNGGHSLLRLQRAYFLALAVAGAFLGWLLAWLNLFAESWLLPASHDFTSSLLQTLIFALLAPLVLLLRTAFVAQAGLLKLLTGMPALRFISRHAAAHTLLTLALLGLTVGSVWPQSGFWLLWLAPLALLVALQLLWHESTVFDGIPHGDWGRVLGGALSGLVAGNLLVFTFELGGGTLIVQLPQAGFAQLGYALLGLLCLQLGDVVAEFWRGKSRGEVFKRKPFPISVVKK